MSAKAKAVRAAAYGVLIVVAFPATLVVSIAIDLVRVCRNRGKWTR